MTEKGSTNSCPPWKSQAPLSPHGVWNEVGVSVSPHRYLQNLIAFFLIKNK